ncbi:hypothetical protein K504DRAFT_260624 [Pleomassaria siparia CBS 279.74]|uniref:Uncharacterized protein n=1 Tax=Pleomassaria siparia CBS 279.74 TaxID=1314801 RepID=A0A6G1KD72_9PLEO|nr:hypothetical protein K504DRAFT_260624 [Pleomassaria siparia CBS 279.74]
MRTRAKDLGILWYDYFGVYRVFLFIVILAYQIMRARNVFYAVRATHTARFLDILQRRISKTLYRLCGLPISFVVGPIYFRTFLSR